MILKQDNYTVLADLISDVYIDNGLNSLYFYLLLKPLNAPQSATERIKAKDAFNEILIRSDCPTFHSL